MEDYLLEKFEVAIYDLATGEGDARSRVDVAFHRFWHIRIEEFPVDTKVARMEIDALITRLPGREGYVIPDNLLKMKNKTASRIAANILDIYKTLVDTKSRRDGPQLLSP